MPTLRSQLDALASSFANAVVDAIRGASLEELMGAGAGARGGSGAGNPPKRGRVAEAKAEADAKPAKVNKSGRLKRRSAEDIAKELANIVALVKTSKGGGMRAEEIRRALKLEAKELPRVLKEGLASKKLAKKGQKRATIYFAK